MQLTIQDINSKIYTIRDMKVMIDSDLAELYEVETKRLKEQVKRNIDRFPSDFMFELTVEEFSELRSQFATTNKNISLRSQFATLEDNRGKHTKYLPFVFTEQGISMLSAVLKSKIAIDISIQIMRTFVELRKFALTNSELAIKFNELEKRVLNGEKVDKQILDVLNVLMNVDSGKTCGKIGFARDK